MPHPETRHSKRICSSTQGVVRAALGLGLCCWLMQCEARVACAYQPVPKSGATEKPRSDPGAKANAESVRPASPEPSVEEAQKELPTLEQLGVPPYERFVQSPPFDWIVLITDRVIEVEPVSPHTQTIEVMQKKIADSFREGGIQGRLSKATARERQKLYMLPVTLLESARIPEGEDRDYELHMRYIKRIVYYEELILKCVDQMLDARRVREANELLIILDDRQPDWPGIAERRQRALFVEAQVKSAARSPEEAFALLEELHRRNPKFPNLYEQLGAVADELIAPAIRQEDYRRARFFLRRFVAAEPAHPAAARWTAELQTTGGRFLADAMAAEQAGKFALAWDAIERASRAWPENAEVFSAFGRIARRFQRLRVGVCSLPPVVPARFFPSRAEQRLRRVTEPRLFEPARLDHKLVRYETRFFNSWEPTELGHSVAFSLGQHRRPWESQPLLTAGTLADLLAARLDPDNPFADQRFANYVESLEVRSPFELIVNFKEVPLRPESIFAFPITVPAIKNPAARDPKLAADLAGTPLVFPFHVQARASGQIVLERAIAETAGPDGWHVAEVREERFETFEKSAQALFRGDVTLLPRIPAWNVKSFEGRTEFFTQAYAIPTTHVLQFNPDSVPLANRTLRRALVYAMNRPQILESAFLHEPPGRLGRLTSAPFSTGSYAYHPLVEPHKTDPQLAIALAAAAKKELGGKPLSLRMRSPDEPEIVDATRRLIEQWKKIGLTVELQITGKDAGAGEQAAENLPWDIAYNLVNIADPLVELWPCVTVTRGTDADSLTHLPAWLRQDLLALDDASDWPTAETLLHKIHEDLWTEVHLIPLWEINDYMVFRKNLRGVPAHPMHSYHGLERWILDPWYPRDL